MQIMQIITVKDITSGYLINGSVFVPKDSSNREYQLVRQWIADGGSVDPEFSLEEIQIKKIAEIKALRDSKNIEPITNEKAFLIDKTTGQITKLESNFAFHTNRHPVNPASDPTSILAGVVVLNSAIPYSTKDLDGNKIVISLTPEIARALSAHLVRRNNANYKLSDTIEAEIKSALSIEEVEAITWENE